MNKAYPTGQPSAEEASPILSDKEIFTRIWTSPRAVFRFLHQNNYDKFLVILLLLNGVAQGISNATNRELGDTNSLLGILAIAIIGGGLFGWIGTFIFAALLNWTGGGWLNGQANTRELLRVLAYAAIPVICTLLLFAPQIAFYQADYFSDNRWNDYGFIAVVVNLILGLLQFGLAVWSFILSLVGISEVQGFSKGKAFLNMVLAILVIAVPLLIAVMMVGGASAFN